MRLPAPIWLFALIFAAMSLAGCLGGGGGDTAASVAVVDKAAADAEAEKDKEDESEGDGTSDGGNTDMMDTSAWENEQAAFLVVRTEFPDMLDVDGIQHRKDTTAPDGIFRYEGAIDGTMNPNRDYLSDPRIALDYNSGMSSMRAGISYEHEGTRVTMDRYGASVNADGSFSSFDGLNAKGFDGAFYGDNSFVSGSVSTPRVHGTYVAQ